MKQTTFKVPRGTQSNGSAKMRQVIISAAQYKHDLERLVELERLCARAADALDLMTQMLLISDVPLDWEEPKTRANRALIAELRKAAESS